MFDSHHRGRRGSPSLITLIGAGPSGSLLSTVPLPANQLSASMLWGGQGRAGPLTGTVDRVLPTLAYVAGTGKSESRRHRLPEVGDVYGSWTIPKSALGSHMGIDPKIS